jgi:Spy/CpxP family protein refolding chaperone
MKKTIITLVILITFSLVLFAQMNNNKKDNTPCDDCDQNGMMMQHRNGMGNMPDMQKHHKQMLMEELKLSKEQMKKIDALRADHEKAINLKQAELENLMIDERNAMQNDKFDQVKAINKSIADLRLFIANARVDHHAAMLKELTPEQKDKFKEIMPMGKGKMDGQGMGKGRGKGMGKGMGHGMGPDCAGDCK